MKKFNFHNTYEERQRAFKTFKSHDKASRKECYDMLWDIIVDQGVGTRKVLEDLGLDDLVGDEEFLSQTNKEAILQILERVPSEEVRAYATNFKAEDIAPEAENMLFGLEVFTDFGEDQVFVSPNREDLDAVIEVYVNALDNVFENGSATDAYDMILFGIAKLVNTKNIKKFNTNDQLPDNITYIDDITVELFEWAEDQNSEDEEFEADDMLHGMGKAHDGERPEKKIIEITAADEDRWEEIVRCFDTFKNKLDAQVREFLNDREQQPEGALTLEDVEDVLYRYTVLAGKHAFDLEPEQMEEEVEVEEPEQEEVEAIEEEIPAEQEEDELEKLLAGEE